MIVIGKRFIRVVAYTALTVMLMPCALVSAQPGLPAPSRIVYKCHVGGTVSYSDEPCIGARRLDATPTRGVDHLSGSRRIGKDVANEMYVEGLADALRPVTGMSASQFSTAARRYRLDPAARHECGGLEPAILRLEEAEKRADAIATKSIQQDLFTLRKRYKVLAC